MHGLLLGHGAILFPQLDYRGGKQALLDLEYVVSSSAEFPQPMFRLCLAYRESAVWVDFVCPSLWGIGAGVWTSGGGFGRVVDVVSGKEMLY